VHIHYVTSASDLSFLYHCYIPSKYLPRFDGVKVTISSYPGFVEEENARKSDVVVLQCQTKNSVFQFMKKASDKVFIYDIDASLWGLYSGRFNGRFWEKGHLRVIKKFMDFCHGVTVHSSSFYGLLVERFPELKEKIYLLPPLVDFEKSQVRKRCSSSIRIGWQGLPFDFKMSEHVAHAVAQVIRGGYDVKAVWFGFLPSALKGLKWWEWEYYAWPGVENFYDVLGSLGLDIGLLPVDPEMHDGELVFRRLLDYAMFKVAVVATNVESLSGAVGCFYGVDLSNKLNKWRRSIMDLLENEGMRSELSERLYEFALQFDASKRVGEWLEVYKEISR